MVSPQPINITLDRTHLLSFHRTTHHSSGNTVVYILDTNIIHLSPVTSHHNILTKISAMLLLCVHVIYPSILSIMVSVIGGATLVTSQFHCSLR